MPKRLLLVSLLLLGPFARAQVLSQPATPAESAERDDFKARMDVLAKLGAWQALLTNGRDWQQSHPTAPNGWWTAGKAAYNLGDVDAAIRDYSKGDEMAPPAEPDVPLETARKVRANFPRLQLKPLQFVASDIKAQDAQWHAKGVALLQAERYDEIEKVSRDLQKSNAHSADGAPFLRYFFEGLRGRNDDKPTAQSALEAWKAARPHSDLARIVSVQWWTDEAWRMRGQGYGDNVTADMIRKMEDNIAHASTELKALPPTAFDSPLAYDATLAWEQLSGEPRDSLDKTFKVAADKFPDHQPLFRGYTLFLMPRWFGAPGEMEAFVTHRADTLGGDKGDIFYARMVWSQLAYYGNPWKETAFSYDRFKRGMIALCKAEPDSVSAPSALLITAQKNDDSAAVKAFFASPRGNLMDGSRWNADERINLPDLRMQMLAK